MMCKNITNKNEKTEQAAKNTAQAISKQQPVTTTNETLEKMPDKRAPSICIVSNCHKIVEQAATKSGLRQVGPKSPWNLLWTDATLTVQQCRELKKYQMVNFFPGIGEIARKDLLARNLARMHKLFPEDYDFFPKTWWLPADLGDVLLYARSKRGETYIVKPGCGSQGRGILITKNLSDLEFVQQSICQVYLPRPLLIDGFKFDIRIYTVITSCDPLRVFVYNEGIVRFATHKYSEPTTDNVNNVFMHLTNYAINKNHRGFVTGEEGSKRRISALNSWLAEREVDVTELWRQIDDVIVKTVVTCGAALKHQYHLCFPRHQQAAFVLLGIDVLLDVNLKPYLIEVNRCPSLNIDSEIDEEVKEQLLVDTFTLLNLKRLDQQRVQGEEKRRVYQRTQRTINRLAKRFEDCPLDDYAVSAADSMQSQVSWEAQHTGNFRLVYPAPGDGSDKYDGFVVEASNTLYQETAASRARRDFALQHRLESAAVDVEDGSCGEACDDNDAATSDDDSSRNKTASQKMMIRGRIPILNSFEPQYISRAEERERLRGLEKREDLVRSLNLRAHITHALRMNGDLRAEEEVVELHTQTPRVIPPVSPGSGGEKLHVRATAPPSWPRRDLLPPLERQHSSAFNNGVLYTSSCKKPKLLPAHTIKNNNHELRVVCHEVPMTLRPLPSRVSRWASLNQHWGLSQPKQ